jgi:uncharacterized BrkB/YihY/UPF0761 family membrane protein
MAESTPRQPPQQPPEETPEGDAATTFSDRVVDFATKAFAWTEDLAKKAQVWADRQEARSPSGVAIGWFTRYRQADGQLFALLLAAYLFVTIVPAVIAMASYSNEDPTALAAKLIARLHLKGDTASLVREVLQGAGGHQLTATVIAVASVVTFGMGIGRTLQLIYGRVWGFPPTKGLVDRVRYFLWLMIFLVGCVVYVVEETLLKSSSNWIEWAIAPLWLVAIVGFLAWTPVFLLHNRITVRDAIPGALLAAVGLVILRALSSNVFSGWLNWYSKYYGGIGIVMALFFWIVIATTIMIVTAALSPAYAVRRAERVEAAREAQAPADPDGAG